MGELLLPHRLDRGEEGGDGLADAGRGLTEHARAGSGSTVDHRCHLSLPLAVGGKREREGKRLLIAQHRPVGAQLRPAVVAAQQIQVKAFQLLRGKASGELLQLLGLHLAIDQPHFDGVQLFLLGKDKGIALGLRPVQRVVAGGIRLAAEQREGQLGGLDLLDDGASILPQYAVRPAIDRKEDAVQLPLVRKDDLRAVGFAVALVGLALELAVQAGALVGTLVEVGAAAAVVDAAAGKDELDQLPHRERHLGNWLLHEKAPYCAKFRTGIL